MHDRIFEAASAEGQAGVTFDRLMSYATEIGLNTETFISCLNNPETARKILDIRAEGVAQGVTGTPTVLINGKLMENAFDIEAISAEIESQLAQN